MQKIVKKKKSNKTKERQSKDSSVVLYTSLMAQSTSHNDWFIDSGASAHMKKYKSILINTKVSQNKEVVVANNEKFSIDCSGDVELNL